MKILVLGDVHYDLWRRSSRSPLAVAAPEIRGLDALILIGDLAGAPERDPSRWPSHNRCLEATRAAVTAMRTEGLLREVDTEAAARLLYGAALNAALWVASCDDPAQTLSKAQEAFRLMAEGLLTRP